MNDINKIKNNAHAKFMAKDNLIGRHKYNSLKMKELEGKIPLIPEEKLQIEAYENKGIKPLTEDQAKKIVEYYKKVASTKPKREYHFDSKQLLDILLNQYKKEVLRKGYKLIVNDDVKSNILPLIYYFTKDDRFFKCKNIVREFNYGSVVKYSEPSFEKGLLIVGGYGNGKSSIMTSLQMIFANLDNLKFRVHNANDIIELFESCESRSDKDAFWYRMKKDVIYFDDVKTERIASNYGKFNLFKDILEKRELRDLLTYITCNYRESNPGDLKDALLEFGEMYGSRVFDRLFSMFNIIEFKGKSFRR